MREACRVRERQHQHRRGDVRRVRTRRHPDQVVGFFEALGGAVEVLEFTPVSYAANDENEVHTLIRFAVRSRETGREATMHLHHYWRFRDGKIAYYRGSEDTALTAAMLDRSTVTAR